MKLISMKNKKKKTLRGAKSTKVMEAAPSYDEPKYPWGLELNFEDETLKRLPIDIENIKAGDEVYFSVKAKVNRLSLNERIDEITQSIKNLLDGYRNVFYSRLILGITGLAFLIIILAQTLTSPVFYTLSFLLVLLAELADRFLFYTARELSIF